MKVSGFAVMVSSPLPAMAARRHRRNLGRGDSIRIRMSPLRRRVLRRRELAAIPANSPSRSGSASSTTGGRFRLVGQRLQSEELAEPTRQAEAWAQHDDAGCVGGPDLQERELVPRDKLIDPVS